jgi:hypothetical protein
MLNPAETRFDREDALRTGLVDQVIQDYSVR